MDTLGLTLLVKENIAGKEGVQAYSKGLFYHMGSIPKACASNLENDKNIFGNNINLRPLPSTARLRMFLLKICASSVLQVGQSPS